MSIDSSAAGVAIDAVDTDRTSLSSSNKLPVLLPPLLRDTHDDEYIGEWLPDIPDWKVTFPKETNLRFPNDSSAYADTS